MDPVLAALFKAAVPFVFLAGAGVTGYWLWLRARSAPDLVKLLDALREENTQLHADLSTRMAELEERIDFAERRLAQEREVERLPRPPKARTPA